MREIRWRYHRRNFSTCIGVFIINQTKIIQNGFEFINWHSDTMITLYQIYKFGFAEMGTLF